jgi:serine/threonine protein kinase
MAMNNNRWKAITRSEYAWEQDALDFIKERLPDREPYRAWANFEFIADDGTINEVDLLVLTPRGFFLVEIKSRPGVLAGDAGTWTWITDGRRLTTDNPLIGANRKARKLASLLKKQKSARKARLPFLEALVFCSAPDLDCKLTGNARDRICLRDRKAAGDKPGRPGIMAAIEHRKCAGLKDHPGGIIDRPMAKILTRSMESAGIRESQRKRRVGDYLLGEIIAEGPGYQDWRAVHAAISNIERRVRIYTVRKNAPSEERAVIERAASREFQLLETLQHPGVLRTYGFTEHELGPAIIFEHFPNAMRLDLYLAERGASLGPDQRLSFLRQIGETIDHAHRQRVVHRALSPQSILVIDPEEHLPKIKVFNWQTGYRDASTGGLSMNVTATEHVDQLVEDASTAYMAPEALNASEDGGGEHLDVFSLGAIAFHLFANQPPAANALELSEKLRAEGALRITSVINGAVEPLQFLIQYSTLADVSGRSETVSEFLEGLDMVEETLTTPDELKETVEDPTQAQAGDRLAGGFLVEKRLGSGASSMGFLVKQGDETCILKIALDPDHNDRLREEAEVLRQLRHSRVVEYIDTVEVGNRIGILMRALTRRLKGDKKVVETLRQWLHNEGRLQLDLLQRFGEDLLSAVNHLEEQGVSHRDIKPDNLAVANVGTGDQLHLVLFDFSLSRTPADNIRVGTRGYIDPFIALRQPKRWDLYAERWAAAITLYEMATNSRPVWHDGKTDPAQVGCEATIDAEMFESGPREGLARFFRKALRRDAARRFDNAETMLRAWRGVFEELDQPPVSTSDHAALEEAPGLIGGAGLETPVTELGLSTRAVNALDRVNALTVVDLLAVPIRRLFRLRGVGQKTRREITDAVRMLRERLGTPERTAAGEEYAPSDAESDLPGPANPSVDILADRIARIRETKASAPKQGIIQALLGLDEEWEDIWPTQAATGRRQGVSRARIGQVLTEFIERWRRNPAVTALREEMTRFLDANGGVMTLREMADAILTARGSVHEDPLRSRLARAVVRAAVEVERTLADPRFLVRREGDRVLIAARPDLADYALQLGQEADRIAGEDPLLPSERVLERLQAIGPPTETDAMPPGRLVRLTTAASKGAALSGRQEIYPRGMDAARALKLSQGALLGAKKLTSADIRQRVSGRYPEAAPLPDPPELDRLLKAAGLDLKWDAGAEKGRGAYVFPSYEAVLSGSDESRYRYPTGSAGSLAPSEITPQVAAARQFEERLRHNRDDGGFMALTTPPIWYVPAIGFLAERFDLRVVHLEKLFLDALTETAREKRVDWNKVVQADAASPESRDWQRLLQLVRMTMPRVEKDLFTADAFLLICYAGVLARYDGMGLIDELRDRAGRPTNVGGIPGVWMLIPGDGQSHLPFMEGKAVPVIGSGQHARVPVEWLENRHRRGRKGKTKVRGETQRAGE